MPRQITLDDGSQLEVPTEEELTALRTKATEADTLRITAETLQKEKDAYDKDPVEKNWREMRKTNDNLKAALVAQGKIVSDDGIITEKPVTPTLEEFEATATNAARRVALETAKEQALAGFEPEDRKVVEHYFNKLTTGEEVNVNNIHKFVKDAQTLANPKVAPKVIYANGNPPTLLDPNKVKSFAETPAGQSIANEMFGKDSFAAPKK